MPKQFNGWGSTRIIYFISADFANVSLKLNAGITVAVIYCHTKVNIA